MISENFHLSPDFMPELLSLLCIFAALGLLIALSVIDLKHWILPDELNLAFGLTGLAFHLLTAYRFADIPSMMLGASIVALLLYMIRYFANKHYGRDTLGLGDVKLMGAAGVWLGLEGVMQALTLGAFAGLLHGLAYALWLSFSKKARFELHSLAIPAGPGFAVGIVLVGVFMYLSYVTEVVSHALSP